MLVAVRCHNRHDVERSCAAYVASLRAQRGPRDTNALHSSVGVFQNEFLSYLCLPLPAVCAAFHAPRHPLQRERLELMELVREARELGQLPKSKLEEGEMQLNEANRMRGVQ